MDDPVEPFAFVVAMIAGMVFLRVLPEQRPQANLRTILSDLDG